MDVNAVVDFIAASSEEQAQKINDASIARLRWHMRLRNIQAARNLSRGDKVFWKTEKHGLPRIIKGVIKQINTTTAKVKAEDGQIWRVSLSLLEKEA